jgi:hypothetical protein
LASEFTRNGDFSTLGTRFHDESKDTITGTSDGKVSQKLVFEGLSLGLSAKTTVGNTFSEEINSTFLETKSREGSI